MVEDNLNNVAILARQDSYGEALAENVRKFFEEQGGTVVSYQLYSPEAATYTAEPTWTWLATLVCLPLALPLVSAIDKATGRELIPVLVGTSRLTFVFAAVFAMGIVL